MSAAANVDTKTTTNGDGSVESAAQWLKAELFEELLGRTIDGYKHIKSFKVLPGTIVGENFTTVLLRLEFELELEDGSSKSHSFMIKVGHDTAVFREIIKANNVFVKENEMYMQVVPELEQLYRNVGVDVRFGARCYEIAAPHDYVLMENLLIEGFSNVNRLDCLDVAHTKSVLRKMAQWHAASALRVSLKGPYITCTQGFIANEQVKMLEHFVNSSSKTFLEAVATYKGNEEYLAQMKILQSKIIEASLKLYKLDPYEFNALNHGDLWANNVMFQYAADGQINETYFIDFQATKYCSVALDLYYILLSSVQLEYKLSKFDYFVKYYHDNLIEHLKILKYNKPLPTLKDLHASLYRYDLYAYITIMTVMAAMLLDPTDLSTMENFLNDSADAVDFKKLLYANPRYRKHMEEILPWLYNRGAFET